MTAASVRWAMVGEAVNVALALFALATIVRLCVGCSNPPPAKDVLEEAAADTYAAEHMRCVETYSTNAEINACRAAVRRRWGIAETSRDAGADR